MSGRNIAIQCLAAGAVTAYGLWRGLASWAWVAVILCCALVIALELINTALEKLCDLVEPNRNPIVRQIKDIAAGAVLLAALASIAVAVIVFL